MYSKTRKKTRTKRKKTRHNKSRKHSQAGHTLYSKPITLVFEHALTNDRVLKSQPTSKNTPLKNVIDDINRQLEYHQDIDPIDITQLYKYDDDKVLDIHKTLSQLHLQNNDKIIYITNNNTTISSIKRQSLKYSCLKHLGLIFYVKITYTFNIGPPIYIYLGIGYGRGPLYPPPNIIIITKEDIQEKNLCKHPLIQAFRTKHKHSNTHSIFRVLPGRHINPIRQTYTIDEDNIPEGYSNINPPGPNHLRMNHSLKHWVEVEKYRYILSQKKPMPVGHYVDDIATQYIGFKQDSITSQEKINEILDDINRY